MESHIDNQNPLGILYVDIKTQPVGHCLFHHHDSSGLYPRIFYQIIKCPLFHAGNVCWNSDVVIPGPYVAPGHIADKVFHQKLHIFNIGNNAVGKRVGNMDIPRRLLIHLKSGIAVGK